MLGEYSWDFWSLFGLSEKDLVFVKGWKCSIFLVFFITKTPFLQKVLGDFGRFLKNVVEIML